MNSLYFFLNTRFRQSSLFPHTRYLLLFFLPALLMLLILVLPESSQAGTELNRFRNFEDRLRTEEKLRPLGHDFLIDISAAMSKEILDIVDDAEKASKTSGTDAEKITAINLFLRKYDKTEQFGAAKVTVGIPLPSFSLFGVNLTPDLRAEGSLGAALTMKTKALDLSTIRITDIPGIPSDVSTLLANVTFPAGLNAGVDLVQYAVDQGVLTDAQAAPYVNKYYMPDFSLPNIFVYAKNDIKFILGFQYAFEDSIFGHFNLYNMYRTDKEVRVTEQVLKNDGKIADLKQKNTQSSLNFDYRLGYKYDNYQAALSFEDVKIATLSDKKGPLVNNHDPLVRLHLDGTFRPLVFKLTPFLGVHKRKGYTVSQGMYGGTEAAVTVWGDRLSLALRGMFDKEYFTVTPQVRLWLIQAEYSFRKVLKDTTVDGNRTSNIHSANFRIFF